MTRLETVRYGSRCSGCLCDSYACFICDSYACLICDSYACFCWYWSCTPVCIREQISHLRVFATFFASIFASTFSHRISQGSHATYLRRGKAFSSRRQLRQRTRHEMLAPSNSVCLQFRLIDWMRVRLFYLRVPHKSMGGNSENFNLGLCSVFVMYVHGSGGHGDESENAQFRLRVIPQEFWRPC